MRKSAIDSKYVTSDYDGYEFDPQVNFAQFLEEAKQNAKESNFQDSSPNPEEARKWKCGEDRKCKKSWKNSLISWWKTDKKCKSSMEPAKCSHNPNPKQGHVSGPIYGSGRGLDMRLRRPTSGPLTYLFNPTRRRENETSYVCLDQLNRPHNIEAYGPVYMVT